MKHLTATKRVIIIVYCLSLVIICTYVPWEAGTANSTLRMPAGYTYIWNAPQYYMFYPDKVKVIGDTNKTNDENSIYNRYMQSQESKNTLDAIWGTPNLATKLPIAGIDIKRILIEFIGVTALFGVIYFIKGFYSKKEYPSI
jgi:hypothetical protein